MILAYLFSLLARQERALKASFAVKYPGAWLVWEPGAWTAPDASQSTRPFNLDEQSTPVRGGGEGKGDALCFHLVLPQGRPGTLNVGRSPDNDVQLNDATVSRYHLVLKMLADRSWQVAATAGAKSSSLNGTALTPGQTVSVRNGDRISLGEVLLTFHDRDGFSERLHSST